MTEFGFTMTRHGIRSTSSAVVFLQTTPPNQQLLWQSATVFNESWSANAGLTYAVSQLIDLSLLSATSYRAPSLEERFQYIDLGSIVHVGNPNLQPERSVSVNGGFTLHSATSNIRSDIFLNQLSDLVTDIPGVFEGRAATVKANIGQARLYGYDISGEKKFLSWSAVRFSVAYVRGEDTRNHLNLPQISPLQGQISLSVIVKDAGAFDLASSFAMAKGNAAAGEVLTSGYALLDAGFVSVPLRISDFSFTIRTGIQNVLNKDYRDFISTLRGVVLSEPGRNFYLSAGVAISFRLRKQQMNWFVLATCSALLSAAAAIIKKNTLPAYGIGILPSRIDLHSARHIVCSAFQSMCSQFRGTRF